MWLPHQGATTSKEAQASTKPRPPTGLVVKKWSKKKTSPPATQDHFLGAEERVVSCVLIFQDKEVRLTADGDQCWEA